MAAYAFSGSVECSALCVPSSFFQSISSYDNFQIVDETIKFGLGSNSILINENTGTKLGVNERSRWAALTFTLRLHGSTPGKNTFTSKRFVHIVFDHNVSDGIVVLSEDLLFNLGCDSGFRSSLGTAVMKKLSLTLINEPLQQNLPTKASKVVLSLFQSETCLEDSFVDKMLQNYFAYPRYLCNNDVFSVDISKIQMLDLVNTVNNGSVSFKVCEILDHSGNIEHSGVTRGFFVDSLVTMYQVSSLQGFFPSRKLPLCLKPNLHSLLCDANLMTRIRTADHILVPASFDEVFHTLFCWLEPFLNMSESLKDVALNPVFLMTGPNGSGKSLLLQALSQFLGMSYSRVDCVSVGGAIPGQAEAKVKAIFNQLKNLAPCILQLANIEFLWEDADSKEDVRVISFFENQVKTLKPKWPVVVVCTSQSSERISSGAHHLFLDSATVRVPNSKQREEILSWLSMCHMESLEQQTLQAVAAQTSGFVFRDLQLLFTLALKEKFKRSKEKTITDTKLIMSDFSKIIGLMHKAFSESIGAPQVPSVLWKDVGGLEHLKKEILRSLQSNLFNAGLRRSGLLLHGPPGTGKTLIAKAVATQCGRNFLSVKGPELLNMYVGQSEHNVRDLFELAKVASPCIVFFDELDSLAPNRGRSGDSGGVMDRVVSQLLAEIDDLGSSGDVFILGATNRPDLIDPALLRPGRLDKLLYVGLCEDRESQLSVITALTRKVNLAADVDLKAVVSQLPSSVSGAQMSALCSAAWLSSATQIIKSGEHKSKTSVAVHQDHFLSALVSVFNQH